MGSFIGHVIGVFFSLLGYWWATHMLIRYFKSRGVGRRSFTSSPLFDLQLCRRRVPVEAIAILFFSFCGYLAELFFSRIRAHNTEVGGNSYQHAACYMFFTLAAITWILFDCVKIFPRKTKEDIIYALLVLAFAVEGMVFSHHLDGRVAKDVRFHTYEMYTFLLTSVATIFECIYRDNIVCSLARPYFIILQGTWLTHMGFALYPPWSSAWGVDPNSTPMTSREGMIITAQFILHGALVFASLLLLALGLGLYYKKAYPLKSRSIKENHASHEQEVTILMEDVDPDDF